MRSASLLVPTLGGIALAAISAQSQNGVTYTFKAFEIPFATGINTKPFAINARGDTLGRYFDSSTGGHPRGFLRCSDGGFAPSIDVPSPNGGTALRGLDSRDDVTGKCFDAANPNETHGFSLTAGGAFVTREPGRRAPRLQSTARDRS